MEIIMPTKKKTKSETKENKGPTELVKVLVDPTKPAANRRGMLRHVCEDGGEEFDPLLDELLRLAGASTAESVLDDEIAAYKQRRKELDQGPVRLATFMGYVNGMNGGVHARGHVRLEEGGEVLPFVPDEFAGGTLSVGDRIYLDASGATILGHFPKSPVSGESAVLERTITDSSVLVKLRGDEQLVLLASQVLRQKIADGDAQPGCRVLANVRQMIAFDTIPEQEGWSHFEFLDKSAVPDVVVGRDVGAPPLWIRKTEDHVRSVMMNPEIRLRYQLAKSRSEFLIGPSGVGKTLSINATIRCIYEVMSEITGVPIEDLPPRVLRLRAATILSKYVGESDRLLDRFFDEAAQLARTPFVAPDGQCYYLPVIVIGEEIEGLARSRGGDADGIYDRILTTALQRLDPGNCDYKDHLIIYCMTSNLPEVIDHAMWRRIGAHVERFTRLTNRRRFEPVLTKLLGELPMQSSNGTSQARLRKDAIVHITSTLFSQNGNDKGQVELMYVGLAEANRKFQRDFLTGAIVGQAVAQAAEAACMNEEKNIGDPGINSTQILDSIHVQVQNIVEQLTAANAGNFLDLPDGMRVASVRKIEQPAITESQLTRAAS